MRAPAGAAHPWLVVATTAAHRGDAWLVPPNGYQAPFQKMASPWFGSAEADTSGTSRHWWLAGTPQVKDVSAHWAAGTCCQDAAANWVELPPPLAPPLLFQVVSVGAPAPAAVSEVPPTPVTPGWSAGSSTARPVNPGVEPEKQSLDPASPDAATIVWPWVAALANSVCSVARSLGSIIGSHWPQLVDSTLAVSASTMAE